MSQKVPSSDEKHHAEGVFYWRSAECPLTLGEEAKHTSWGRGTTIETDHIIFTASDSAEKIGITCVAKKQHSVHVLNTAHLQQTWWGIELYSWVVVVSFRQHEWQWAEMRVSPCHGATATCHICEMGILWERKEKAPTQQAWLPFQWPIQLHWGFLI